MSSLPQAIRPVLPSLKLRHLYDLSAPQVQQLHKKSDGESKKTIDVINFVYHSWAGVREKNASS